jgi:hypothetical protein
LSSGYLAQNASPCRMTFSRSSSLVICRGAGGGGGGTAPKRSGYKLPAGGGGDGGNIACILAVGPGVLTMRDRA